MSTNNNKTKQVLLSGSIIAGAILGTGAATNLNAANLFEFGNLGSGAELRTVLLQHPSSRAALELKCGGAEKKSETKAGSKTKSDSKTKDAKCGEGKCGGDKKAESKSKDAKCGEGKCGGEMKSESKSKDAKCGEKKMDAAKEQKNGMKKEMKEEKKSQKKSEKK